jgi:hypothetical protein
MKPIILIFILLTHLASGLESRLGEKRIHGERILYSIRGDNDDYYAVIASISDGFTTISPIREEGRQVSIEVDGVSYVIERPGIYLVEKRFGQVLFLRVQNDKSLRDRLIQKK